jgi:hypothetical protein
MTKRQKFTVKDHDRTFVFNGVCLGRATSQTETKKRWTEMAIYRTDAGTYIISGIGQTRVKAGDKVWDEDEKREVTAPADETPRAWAHVCESAEGAIQRLYLYDGDDVRYMTRVARTALLEAIELDDMLKSAFLIEEVA